MKFNLLGSGGVFAPPRAGCKCNVCEEARKKGIPHARTGSSLYNYDAKLLFDTPEEIRIQLNREMIFDVKHVILTHWHPDHTMGLRVLEHLNLYETPIHVYMSKHQKETFQKLSCGSFLDYYEKNNIIQVHDFSEEMDFGAVKVKPYYIEKTQGYYFLITDGKKQAIYAPCEYHGLKVHDSIKDVDVFIPHHLYYQNNSISEIDYSSEEDSFEKMLEDAKQMNAKRIIVTHIEEIFGMNHHQLNKISKKKFQNYNLEFGYDGMHINL